MVVLPIPSTFKENQDLILNLICRYSVSEISMAPRVVKVRVRVSFNDAANY